MNEPTWITRLMVDAIHADLLSQHGGLHGVRDENAIESALARHRNRWSLDPEATLSALAAAYAFGITRNHPFSDGNKRTAFMLMYVFLGLNDVDLDAEEPDVVLAMLDLAERKLSEEEFAEWIDARAVRAPPSA